MPEFKPVNFEMIGEPEKQEGGVEEEKPTGIEVRQSGDGIEWCLKYPGGRVGQWTMDMSVDIGNRKAMESLKKRLREENGMESE